MNSPHPILSLRSQLSQPQSTQLKSQSLRYAGRKKLNGRIYELCNCIFSILNSHWVLLNLLAEWSSGLGSESGGMGCELWGRICAGRGGRVHHNIAEDQEGCSN